jgi:hypothetical protein
MQEQISYNIAMANVENGIRKPEGSTYQRIIKPTIKTLYELAPVPLAASAIIFISDAVAYSNPKDAYIAGGLSTAYAIWEVGKTAISIRRRRKKLLSRIQK